MSPAKMALRRHLSQEKLGTPMAPKTIGDLVNGEIERTLEISHQSIINAAVNMSTTSQHANPVEVFNVQRPERVNVRGPEEYLQQQQAQQYSGTSYRGADMRRSPGPFGGHENHHKINSVASTASATSAKGTSNLFMASYSSNSLNAFGHTSSTSGPGTSSCLPRAEMKPYLEQYFMDDQFGKGASGKIAQSRSGMSQSVNRGGGVAAQMADDQNSHRMSGPLEGLAASLQARVRATLNIKEEPEAVGRGLNMGPRMTLHPHPHIKQEGMQGNILGVWNVVEHCF